MSQMSPEYKHAWYLTNRERISKKNKERREHRKIIHNAWAVKNREHIRKRNASWRAKNRDKVRANDLRWRRNNPNKVREIAASCRRNRLSSDLNFKLLHNLRISLNKSIRRKGGGERSSARKLLGCSISDFKIYLESKFEPGMSWNNYGKRGWHIDHIMPCAIFDLSKLEHLRRCFHFSNMQPMWAHENHCKNSKILSDQFRLL